MIRIDKFNIRVYGIAISKDKVLLAKEEISGNLVLKFPGGGLEFGEGLKDALFREFVEETGVQPLSFEHVCTTDFFVRSAFNPNEQVVAVYYRVRLPDFVLPSAQQIHPQHRLELFWQDVQELTLEELTFPSDKNAWALMRNGQH